MLINNFVPKTTQTIEELVQDIKKSSLEYDFEKIREAYNFALNLHTDNKRASGETEMQHILTVAGYIAALNLDTTSIIAVLLHDSIKDGHADINQIDKLFGTEVAFIVDGLANVREISSKINDDTSAIENFKNLIFSVAEDVRIIIIRLAEKLHNLISIDKLDHNSQINAAKKALKIYGPLAEYLGLGFFQRNLEDIAFRVLNPEEYNFINNKINEFFIEQKDLIQEFKNDLSDLLKQYKVQFLDIQSRRKGVYSTYRKLKSRYLEPGQQINDKNFNKMKDIFAARIILENIEQCYMVLGLVHSKWEFDKDSFDDYIAKPKDNGYRSIQTCILYKGAYFEVQIRTREMHDYNEFGPASHIAYKLSGSKKSVGSTLTWTKDLVKWQNSNLLKKDDFKIKVFADSVFVFTPKGLLIRLEKGGTPLDFAFRVHTLIGARYVGALVNGKMVSMDYELKTGDVVEILTGKALTANSGWLRIAKSTNTKSKIRKYSKSNRNL